jgi:hypothetical protein
VAFRTALSFEGGKKEKLQRKMREDRLNRINEKWGNGGRKGKKKKKKADFERAKLVTVSWRNRYETFPRAGPLPHHVTTSLGGGHILHGPLRDFC